MYILVFCKEKCDLVQRVNSYLLNACQAGYLSKHWTKNILEIPSKTTFWHWLWYLLFHILILHINVFLSTTFHYSLLSISLGTGGIWSLRMTLRVFAERTSDVSRFIDLIFFYLLTCLIVYKLFDHNYFITVWWFCTASSFIRIWI